MLLDQKERQCSAQVFSRSRLAIQRIVSISLAREGNYPTYASVMRNLLCEVMQWLYNRYKELGPTLYDKEV